MHSKTFLLEISPVLRDIEAARGWEQGATWEEGEVAVSTVELVKVALLLLLLV
jgi:hypothetical protein